MTLQEQVHALEAVLAYQLATAEKSGEPITDAEFEAAKPRVSFDGALTSQRILLERLDSIMQEIRAAAGIEIVRFDTEGNRIQ